MLYKLTEKPALEVGLAPYCYAYLPQNALQDPPIWRQPAPTQVRDRGGKKTKQTNSNVIVLENIQKVNHLHHCLPNDVGLGIWELNHGKVFQEEKAQQETPVGCFNFPSWMFPGAAFACFLRLLQSCLLHAVSSCSDDGVLSFASV